MSSHKHIFVFSLAVVLSIASANVNKNVKDCIMIGYDDYNSPIQKCTCKSNYDDITVIGEQITCRYNCTIGGCDDENQYCNGVTGQCTMKEFDNPYAIKAWVYIGIAAICVITCILCAIFVCCEEIGKKMKQHKQREATIQATTQATQAAQVDKIYKVLIIIT